MRDKLKIMVSAFISYSTDASKKADSVSRHLSSLGVNSFVFEKDLSEKTEDHHSRIKSEIRNMDSVVLILSARSKDSSWVSHELGIATGMDKPIFVFKTSHNLRLPNYLDSYQATILNKIDDLDIYFGSDKDEK